MLIGLVDCNNFYASAERLFDPSLLGRAVVVLSSNDGNVVARSQEAKDLGIEMGIPAYQLKPLVAAGKLTLRSSNFVLYGDVSSRVMSTIATLAPRMEIYSIDEAFVDLTGVPDPCALAREIRERVAMWCGIPVSLGIAETRTLAKLANRAAKKEKAHAGVFAMPPGEDRDRRLAELQLTDVWGIAVGLERRLQAVGISTPAELRAADPIEVQKHLGIVGRRVVEELRGESCYDFDTPAVDRKSICVSRSFGAPAWTLQDLSQAVAAFATSAGEKLRRYGVRARRLQVFAHNSQFRTDEKHVYHARTMAFPTATDDTGDLLAAASVAVRNLYVAGVRYTSAGVLLTEIQSAAAGEQTTLFDDPAKRARRVELLQVLDALNREHRGTVRFASAGLGAPWAPRAEHRSPKWTTSWNELPTAKA